MQLPLTVRMCRGAILWLLLFILQNTGIPSSFFTPNADAAPPDGLTETLSLLLSPAYQGSEVTHAGPMNTGGQIFIRFIPDPNDPGRCYKGGIMFNAARVIKGNRVFDRTEGILSGWSISQ